VLCCAVLCCAVPCVNPTPQLLIDSLADLSLTDGNGWSALLAAACNGQDAVCSELVGAMGRVRTALTQPPNQTQPQTHGQPHTQDASAHNRALWGVPPSVHHTHSSARSSSGVSGARSPATPFAFGFPLPPAGGGAAAGNAILPAQRYRLAAPAPGMMLAAGRGGGGGPGAAAVAPASAQTAPTASFQLSSFARGTGASSGATLHPSGSRSRLPVASFLTKAPSKG
jgi:hypothetical protein